MNVIVCIGIAACIHAPDRGDQCIHDERVDKVWASQWVWGRLGA